MIAATTTRKGLTVHAAFDPGEYPTGIKVSDRELKTLYLTRHKSHGDQNYTILP